MSKPVELYACLYTREFPAQAMLRLRSELKNEPFAVMQGEPPMQHVCSRNLKARLQGVEHGMTRVEVETIPLVVTLPRSCAEEATAKTAMLQCASTFSPSIEDRSDDSTALFVIDIAGTDKLHGSPATLGRTLLDRTAASGIASSVAIANNFHAAICIARGMYSKQRVTVVPSGEESTALAPLPLQVLTLSEDQAETFALWGIRTLGMLAALPEKALIARIGQEGKRLGQLACGAAPHLFVPMEPAFALSEFMELDTPVELLDSLLFVVGLLLEQLIVRAMGRVLALASVTITLSLEGGAEHSRTVRPALPNNDRQLWIKLLHLDLEAHPPNAAILSLRLTAESGNTSKVQLGLFSPQLPESTRLDVTLARIQAIVGEGCVGSPVLKDSHRSDAFEMKQFAVPTGSTKASTSSIAIAAMRRLRPAEQVAVTLRNQHPVSFLFQHERYEVQHAYGPWLTGDEWWTQTSWSVEQWDLVARSHGGVLLCCCLTRDVTRNHWQMVALYD